MSDQFIIILNIIMNVLILYSQSTVMLVIRVMVELAMSGFVTSHRRGLRLLAACSVSVAVDVVWEPRVPCRIDKYQGYVTNSGFVTPKGRGLFHA